MEKIVWRCGQSDWLLFLECPMDWDDLEGTSDQSARFCKSCQREVHYCIDAKNFIEHAKKKECVAIPMAYRVGPNDIKGYLGMPGPWSAELEERAVIWWNAIRDSIDDSLAKQITREMTHSRNYEFVREMLESEKVDIEESLRNSGSS